MRVLDSRRLTGGNLFQDQPGAVLDVSVRDEDRDLLVAAARARVKVDRVFDGARRGAARGVTRRVEPVVRGDQDAVLLRGGEAETSEEHEGAHERQPVG